ncbi:uncharacterized protein LOC134722307 [Mytilus trossulus]|uniref:uncharacterized protein LOC134722307 n=1 Tax=Mytilus trossulus TaxID=6551 RepID=UPI0030075561
MAIHTSFDFYKPGTNITSMEYIKKYIDPDYPSFYSDIWKSVGCESGANFYAGDSDDKIYINDFTNGFTFKLHNISFESVQTVHGRNRKQSGYSMKLVNEAFKFYSNYSTRKEISWIVNEDYSPVSNFKILSWNKHSTINVKNNVRGIKAECVNTDNISSLPAMCYYTNKEFFYTDEFLDIIGISRDMDRKEYHQRSKRLYSFLKDNIGNEELVETRRTLMDNKFKWLCGAFETCFVSGSKAEGLDIIGSDTDHMCVIDDADEIDGNFRVQDGFIFDSTSDTTSPGYISIRQVRNGIISNIDYSSSKFKLIRKEEFEFRFQSLIITYKHGPSISTSNSGMEIDWVYCFKSEIWPRIATEFANRHRCFEWPSKELDFHITESGCHVVPKSSVENQHGDEWRLSFSQAENALVRSFNHTQLMTYGALKIVFEEIFNEKGTNYECVFASYILKTALFWVSEDHEQIIWQPSNIILCITLCIIYLRKCVKNMNCPNFFVETNNMYLDKYPEEAIPGLLEILDVVSSNILRLVWQATPFSISKKDHQVISGKNWEIANNVNTNRLAFLSYHKILIFHQWKYHRCKTNNECPSSGVGDKPVHKFLKKLILYPCYQFIKCPSTPTNKHDYVLNKLILQFILRGNKVNKVTAELNLASWFYNFERYEDCLQVIDVALEWIGNAVYIFDISGVFQNQTVDIQVVLQSYHFREMALKFHLEPYKMFPNSNCAIDEMKECMKYCKSKLKATVLDDFGLIIHAETYCHFLRFLCYHKQKRFRKRSISLKDLYDVKYLEQCAMYQHNKFYSFLLGEMCKQLIKGKNENIDYDKIFVSMGKDLSLDIIAETGINTSKY